MEIAIAIIGSSAFTAIVNAIIELIKNKTGKKSNADKGIMFALLFALQSYGEKLIKAGVIDIEDYRQFDEMYQTYKALGGNGYAERMKQEVDRLPILAKYNN